jgi:hypothetical protein
LLSQGQRLFWKLQEEKKIVTYKRISKRLWADFFADIEG